MSVAGERVKDWRAPETLTFLYGTMILEMSYISVLCISPFSFALYGGLTVGNMKHISKKLRELGDISIIMID